MQSILTNPLKSKNFYCELQTISAYFSKSQTAIAVQQPIRRLENPSFILLIATERCGKCRK